MIKINKEFFEKIIDSISFLVVIHTENESKEFLKKINSYCNKDITNKFLKYESKMEFNKKTIYEYTDFINFRKYYICSLGFQNIVVTVSKDMGSIKTTASNNTISAAIDLCKPKFVIMLGICASLKEKVKICDVVIANTIIGYDSQKLIDSDKGNTKIIDRFGRYNSSEIINLYDNIFVSQFNDTHYYNFHCGSVISSETLLNSKEKKNKIIETLPEAIAYEMESIGLASSCTFKGIKNWIFIKGVSDNGTNKNDTYQSIAMNNAIEVSMNIFERKYEKSLLKKDCYREKRKSIFISSSFIESDDEFEEDIIVLNKTEKENYIKSLVRELITNEYKIISGCGRGILNPLLATAYEEIQKRNNNIDDYIDTIIFPFDAFSKKEIMDAIVENQRKTLISKAKISFFVFGRKTIEGQNIDATGVYKEYLMSVSNGNYIIPIGIFGGMSKKIWDELKDPNNTILKIQFGEKEQQAKKILTDINENQLNHNFRNKEEMFSYINLKLIELLNLLKY